MDSQARHLVFHSALVLVAGLLVGVPYGRAVRRNASEHVLKAWRLAHDTLTVGPILGLAIAAIPLVIQRRDPCEVLARMGVGGFELRLLFVAPPRRSGGSARPHVGQAPCQSVFVGNMVGLGAASVGAVVFLYAAYVSLI
jgi:hypothetical protein